MHAIDRPFVRKNPLSPASARATEPLTQILIGYKPTNGFDKFVLGHSAVRSKRNQISGLSLNDCLRNTAGVAAYYGPTGRHALFDRHPHARMLVPRRRQNDVGSPVERGLVRKRHVV